LTNVSAKKKWHKLEKPYSSWVLACCQFSDSVELYSTAAVAITQH